MSTVPTHGKYAALYVYRPNGFRGTGLNDVTWGTGATNAATAYYEVMIMAAAVPDTFKWRKDGGAWDDNAAAGYAITGAAQTLDEAQTITFAATTGHTATDYWVIGNLKTEATTEAGTTAQITTVAHRMINPNSPPTWTDDGGKIVLQTNFTNGTATFSGNVGNVTVTGNNAWIPSIALTKVGYLKDWSLNITLDMVDASRCGQDWKEAIPGQAGGTGSANAHFIATETLLNNLVESLAGDKYQLCQFFTWDADKDQTGDHITAWVTFTGFSPSGNIGSVVGEAVNFTIQGSVSYTDNV